MWVIVVILKDDLNNIILDKLNLRVIELHLNYYLKRNLKISEKLRNENCGGRVVLEEDS